MCAFCSCGIVGRLKWKGNRSCAPMVEWHDRDAEKRMTLMRWKNGCVCGYNRNTLAGD